MNVPSWTSSDCLSLSWYLEITILSAYAPSLVRRHPSSLAMADDALAIPANPAAILAAAIAAALPPPPPHNASAALAMINIKSHIPIVLELNPPNYRAWRELFVTLLGKFSTSNHIDGTQVPEPADRAWRYQRLSNHHLQAASHTSSTHSSSRSSSSRRQQALQSQSKLEQSAQRLQQRCVVPRQPASMVQSMHWYVPTLAYAARPRPPRTSPWHTAPPPQVTFAAPPTPHSLQQPVPYGFNASSPPTGAPSWDPALVNTLNSLTLQQSE